MEWDEYAAFIKRLLSAPNEATARRILRASNLVSSTDDLAEGAANLYFTIARARAAAVADALVNGVTDVAPSQNAVFDALALKVDASGLSESIDDRVAALLVPGTNITLTYNDAANTLTIDASGGGGSGDVVGPASAVNNRVAFFDGATGKLIKDSGLTLAGSNTGDQTLGGLGGQPVDATLTALAAADWAANALPIGNGADTLSQVPFAANTFPARSSAGNLVAKPITDYGLSLVDDTDASAARTTLGLGTAATQNVGAFDAAGSAAAAQAASQPVDAQLTSLAGLSWTPGTLRVVRENAAGTGFEMAAVSAGSSFFGQFAANFGSGVTPDSVTVTVVDAGVLAGSKIVLSPAGVDTALRDADEAEMEPLDCQLGAITAGVGFEVYVNSRDRTAEGQYRFNYTRD